jgi:hypothetical protein
MEWWLFRVNTVVLAVVVICSDENDNKKRGKQHLVAVGSRL